MIGNIIVIAIVTVAVALAVFYIVRAKRRGVKCIGCSHAKQCPGACNCGTVPKREKEKGGK